MIRTQFVIICGLCLLAGGFSECIAQTNSLTGSWRAGLTSPGGLIEFGLEITEENNRWQAYLINGSERIEIPQVELEGDRLCLRIKHYDSELRFVGLEAGDQLKGTWRKRRGKNEWVTMQFSAIREQDQANESPRDFLGRWAVQFSSSEDPAVAVFEQQQESNRVKGTFLTTTGDYRYLDGTVSDDQLSLSCFDGAHAFLFRARLTENEVIEGEFWSSNTWHETWKANRDPAAKLPEAFAQTIVADQTKLSDLMFPDLTGTPRRLDDPKFAGKARIIYVFGSWCPNCHDAAAYFSELQKRYGDQGLSILGLAFELTGEFERDSRQVREYLDRHDATYPVLIAGLADKSKASQALPLLDRVRSYPTTIFVDSRGQIRGVHTGFTGPATGSEYESLKKKFEDLIKKMLAE
jgi:thiol-disulfide isomerase/thioredoxin